MGKICIVCEKEADVFCENCVTVLNSCQNHKKEILTSHKPDCKPVRVEKNSKYGRYLASSRDLKAGEVVLRERPMVVGPRVDSLPACLECLTLLCPTLSHCQTCGVVPLCTQCSHTPLECRFYASLSDLQRQVCVKAGNQHVLPLKILLHLKSPGGDEKFKRILEMESHMEARRGTATWNSHQKNVVELLVACEVVSDSEEDRELVQHVCGVLDVNSFEVRGGMGLSGMGMRLRGVYPEAALMAHDCVDNVHLSVDDNMVMTVRASVDIPKGRPILYNYTDPLKPTHDRQMHLREGKYFTCQCQRCEDPTELGTFLGALLCPRCKEGLVVPTTGHWNCQKCAHQFSDSLMKGANALARDRLEAVDRTDPQQLEEVLKALSSTFCPSHSIMVDVKQSIVAALRDLEPTRENLLRKVELCKELLPILKIIEPGISRLRGITLYELHIGLVTLAQETGQEDTEVGQWLREAEEALKEAAGLLLYEPTMSPEGALAKQAVAELRSLKAIIAKHEAKQKKKLKSKNKKN